MPFGLGFFATAGAGAGGAAYELISTQVLTSNTASISFSSIPQTYKHLQIRWAVIATGGNSAFYRMRLNGATSGYAHHQLAGTTGTTSIQWYSSTSQSSIQVISRVLGNNFDGVPNSTMFSVGFTDVLDYSSTSKNTTVRSLGGGVPPSPGSNPGEITLGSGFWADVSAITEITLGADFSSNSLLAGSRFSLYGIKG
jgi:hypothetical protein